MSIEIKVLDKPKLPITRMTCDNVLNKKLTKWPMVEQCFSKSSFNVILGKMGQGKTSLVVSLVKTIFKKVFHYIFIIMPDNSRMSIENDIFGKNLPPEQLYNELTEEVLDEIYNKMREARQEGYNSLLIVDDYQEQLKDKDIQKKLGKIITEMRHIKATIFLLQQNYQKLCKSLRELTTNIIFYNVGKSQLKKIFDDAIPMKEDVFLTICKLCFEKKHNWVCINIPTQKIYKGFDEVIVGGDYNIS